MPDPTAKAVGELDRIYKGLQKPDELSAVTAQALVEAAQQRARSRPTPQAPMVAAGFRADADAIRGPSGTLAEITMGSEFGSTRFTQFGPRHSGGSWLFPTIANPPANVTSEQDAYLDDLLHG